jgi:hypothetical protein
MASKFDALKASYDYTNEAVPISFWGKAGGTDVEVVIRLRREDYVEPSNGKQPFTGWMKAFYTSYSNGGHRRSTPSDEAIRVRRSEGFVKFLFDGGDLTREEFEQLLKDREGFYFDVNLALSKQEPWQVAHEAGNVEATLPNFSPA